MKRTAEVTRVIWCLSGLFWCGLSVGIVGLILDWCVFSDNPPMQRRLAPMTAIGGVLLFAGMIFLTWAYAASGPRKSQLGVTEA